MIGSRHGNSADTSVAYVRDKSYLLKIIKKNLHGLERKDILCFGLIFCFFSVAFVYSPSDERTQPSLVGTESKGSTSDVAGYLTTSSVKITKTETWTEYAKLENQQESTTMTPIDPPLTHVKRWATWQMGPGEQLHIDLLVSAELNEERMRAISDVLYSKETLDLDGKTLYKGWQEAIRSTKDTKFPLPLELRTVGSSEGTGQILIALTDQKNPDGYAAFTESVSNEDIHKLLLSKITIFNVENLGEENFKKVLGHELGHAFGLSHADDPDDLMYEIVKTPYPYISECDTQTISGLYHGSETSWVSCEP